MSTADADHLQPGSFPTVFIDFSLNRFTRGDGKPVSLPRNLAVRLLEQLCRTGTSVVRFLLLPRCRQSCGHKSHEHLLNAYRHLLTILRRIIAQFGLPIELEQDGHWIRARWDSKLLR